MMNWTPLDLPFLVEKARLKYQDLIEFWMQQTIDDAKGLANRMGRSAFTLANAQLSWIDSDLCDMLSSVSQDVPEWSPAACIPGPVGFAGFETPFFNVPYESSLDNSIFELPVRGLSWTQFDDGLDISCWVAASDIPIEHRSPLRTDLVLECSTTLKVGINDVLDGAQRIEVAETTGGPRGPYKKAGMVSAAVAGALFLLMTQPRVVAESDTQPVRVRKQGIGPRGETTRVPVRVSVKSLVVRDSSGGGGGGRRGKATSRWWVRGHWRQQPWGKGSKLRKPVWIAPHTAGAVGVEVDERPSVQVFRDHD
ncbi:hypothetical protein [Corynebacterium sp. HMSC08D02]|uniref:hypothetical protein n=1 Tax=Corynebacterium sp. HMSC08D02 TaxID=1581138 RepID=UPI00114CEB62|nr:hypothetical protein [Corynebacterium sp. HMSC08D02]